MSELEVTLRYKCLPAKITFIAMMASTPVWVLAAPVLFGFIIGTVYAVPGFVPLVTVLTVCPALMLLILSALVATSFAEDNRLHVSANGISFPLFMLFKLGFRRHRTWNEVSTAGVAGQVNARGEDPSQLLIGFSDGSILKLRLRNLSLTDTEQLLLAIELWANGCRRSPELIEYQHKIQNKSQGLGNIGYTQMWEEELRRRFQSTSFIPLEPGAVLNNGCLKVIRQLAFGGLSAVYLAQENQSDFVVVKEAVVPQSADPATRVEAEKRLSREAQMLRRLQHPRIAKVLDHFVDGGRHYIKLEYINGTDLRQYIRQNGPVSQSLAIEWGLQILDILEALHRQDPPIIHRDLTPENLVLAKGHIVLIDFGAANSFVGTATGTIVGKQAYMPPEQLRGKSVTESDIYAFAGTMHFLLTGKDPMPLSTARPRRLVGSIDDDLDQIIARCSEYEPQDRYCSAYEVAAALSAVGAKLQAQGSRITPFALKEGHNSA